MVSSITVDPYSIIKSLLEASFTYLKIGLPPRLTELELDLVSVLTTTTVIRALDTFPCAAGCFHSGTVHY